MESFGQLESPKRFPSNNKTRQTDVFSLENIRINRNRTCGKNIHGLRRKFLGSEDHSVNGFAFG